MAFSWSLRIMIDPSDSPTASTTSLSIGQNAMVSGMQGTRVQMYSETDDLLHVKRSIYWEMEADANNPKMGRLQAIFRIAAFFLSLPRLRSLVQRCSLFCSQVSAEQKKISPLELETARRLPWQLYCWSKMTPSCLYVQWKRGYMAGRWSQAISISYLYNQNKELQGRWVGVVKLGWVYNKIIMIGSLGQFIDIEGGNVFEGFEPSERQESELSPVKVGKRRGNSTFEHYVPDDKTDLLVRYEKNNIFNINRKKYTSIAKEVHSKDKIRRPLYEHHSFFVKPEAARDYIAKEQLKRKHNLLRAILRMKQNEEEPKGESDYEQSFQRLYTGFRAIHPHPVLSNIKEPQFQGEEITAQKLVAIPGSKNTSGLSHIKRLQYEQCLSWAKKHHKKGDFFARQLGKLDRKEVSDSPKGNRSLIDQIGKKVQFSLID